MQHNPSFTASSPRISSHFSVSVMSYFRGDDEALLAAALTGFT